MCVCVYVCVCVCVCVCVLKMLNIFLTTHIDVIFWFKKFLNSFKDSKLNKNFCKYAIIKTKFKH